MIGGRITRFRKVKGISQKELAAIINVTPSAVSQWEHDKTIPDTPLLLSLASALGTTVSELVGEEPAEAENTITTEATELFKQLTEAEKNEILEFMRFKVNKSGR